MATAEHEFYVDKDMRSYAVVLPLQVEHVVVKTTVRRVSTASSTKEDVVVFSHYVERVD